MGQESWHGFSGPLLRVSQDCSQGAGHTDERCTQVPPSFGRIHFLVVTELMVFFKTSRSESLTSWRAPQPFFKGFHLTKSDLPKIRPSFWLTQNQQTWDINYICKNHLIFLYSIRLKGHTHTEEIQGHDSLGITLGHVQHRQGVVQTLCNINKYLHLTIIFYQFSLILSSFI